VCNVAKVLYRAAAGTAFQHEVREPLEQLILDFVVTKCGPIADVGRVPTMCALRFRGDGNGTVIGLQVIDLVVTNDTLRCAFNPLPCSLVADVNLCIPVDASFAT